MTKPHGATPNGQPVDLIGQPLHPGRGSVEAVFVRRTENMAKANADGIYTLRGARFKVRKGAVLPDGAVMEGAEVAEEAAAEADVTEQRDKGGAPENRAKADKPEKR
jgi:hypothetical protein